MIEIHPFLGFFFFFFLVVSLVILLSTQNLMGGTIIFWVSLPSNIGYPYPTFLGRLMPVWGSNPHHFLGRVIPKNGILVTGSGSRSAFHGWTEKFHIGPSFLVASLRTRNCSQQSTFRLHNLFKFATNRFFIKFKIFLFETGIGMTTLNTGVPKIRTKTAKRAFDGGLTQPGMLLNSLYRGKCCVSCAPSMAFDSDEYRFIGWFERSRDILPNLGERSPVYHSTHSLTHLSPSVVNEGTKDLMVLQPSASLFRLFEGSVIESN